VPDEQRNIYRRSFVNLPFANGNDSWELPIPGTFVLDRDGGVLYASADEDYTQRPEPREILRQLSSGYDCI
jgi:peroxiredoxin